MLAGLILTVMILFFVFGLPNLLEYFQPPKEPPKNVHSLYITNAPQIDGKIDSLWLTNATVVEPILELVGSVMYSDSNKGTKMYVMNTNTTLYLGIFLPNKIYKTASVFNDLEVYCDANFDGTMDNDDMKLLDLDNSIYKDCWVDIQGGVAYFYQDAISNGFMAYNHTNPIEGMKGNYFFEVALPFNTTLSDPSELNVTRGDSVILAINGFIYLGSGSAYYINWPFHNTIFAVSSFGNITLG